MAVNVGINQTTAAIPNTRTRWISAWLRGARYQINAKSIEQANKGIRNRGPVDSGASQNANQYRDVTSGIVAPIKPDMNNTENLGPTSKGMAGPFAERNPFAIGLLLTAGAH